MPECSYVNIDHKPEVMQSGEGDAMRFRGYTVGEKFFWRWERDKAEAEAERTGEPIFYLY